MAANVQPIYTAVPQVDAPSRLTTAVVGPSANTAEDGSGANMFFFFQAGANGSYVQDLAFVPVLSPAATKCRVWMLISPTAIGTPPTAGTTNTVATMTCLGEVTLPAVAVSLTLQGPFIQFALNRTIPPGCWLAVSFETSTGSAGTGWSVTAQGGTY